MKNLIQIHFFHENIFFLEFRFDNLGVFEIDRYFRLPFLVQTIIQTSRITSCLCRRKRRSTNIRDHFKRFAYWGKNDIILYDHERFSSDHKKYEPWKWWRSVFWSDKSNECVLRSPWNSSADCLLNAINGLWLWLEFPRRLPTDCIPCSNFLVLISRSLAQAPDNCIHS